MSGQFYYRHIDDLALSVCAAKELTDAYWREYLEGAHAISKKHGGVPKVTAIHFAHDYPNAARRRMTAQFLADNEIPSVARTAVFTESVALRGAMTAFSWFMQNTTCGRSRATRCVAASRGCASWDASTWRTCSTSGAKRTSKSG